MRHFSTLVFILISAVCFGQVAISDQVANPTPHSSAILDLQSVSKGLLPPRMTTAERNAINTPANGLIIYNSTTNCFQGYLPSQGWTDLACDCINPPSAAFTGPTNSSIGNSESFAASSPGLNYSWTFQGGTPSSSNSQNPSVQWASAGTYTIQLVVSDANGCRDTSTSTISVDSCVTGGSQTFSYTGSIVNWTVPAGVCSITVEAWGAQGGGALGGYQGGLGARMRGDFQVYPGMTLDILVGQQGINGVNSGDQSGGTGGGGTFVVDAATDTPLVVAGGGGGAMYYSSATLPGGPGLTTPNGAAGTGLNAGAGGTNGNGGVTFIWSGWHSGTGAGGFSGNGVGTTTGSTSYGTPNNPGTSYLNGGAGGIGGSSGRNGGFGGGGSSGFSGGGGGGYSGGGSGGFQAPLGSYSGGGGGSYNVGSNQSNSSGVRSGNGQVVITW